MKNRNSNEFSISNIDEINDSGCKGFKVGEGDWPFHGFLVKYDENIYAYKNYCPHAVHQLNWSPDNFLTPDKKKIICSSHGAIFDIESGLCVSGPCVGSKLLKLECFINNERVIVKLP